jgi:ABC-type multidrug transport system fused ATPase/permease subunit
LGNKGDAPLRIQSKSEDVGIRQCSFEVHQGTLAAIIGSASEGKSTMMRIIGGRLIPDSGDLLIPPHLRVLHISPVPLFFHDTLHENLTYGISKHSGADAEHQRVIAICDEMKISEKITRYLNPENKDLFSTTAQWGEVLSQTQRSQLNLARAFVSNPEVLVLHKPTAVFDDKDAAHIFRCLRKFVDEKGLAMDPAGFHYRRPRTVIMTTSRPQGASAADRVFQFCHQPENGQVDSHRRSTLGVVDGLNITEDMLK